MPRARTGSAFPHGDHFDVQATYPDGRRTRRVCLKPGTTLLRAKQIAAEMTARAARGELDVEAAVPLAPQGETFELYVDRWLLSLRDAREATHRLRLHVTPILGPLAMAAITRRDVERVVASLDEKTRGEQLAAKTARNIWGVVTKLFDDACNSKRLELRVLDEKPNPTDKVRGPDRGDERQSAWLFPREAAAVLACDRAPVRWRILYALALYTGLRSGELAVLHVSDVVLDGGYVNVHKARDRVTGGTKSTKGRRARRVPIDLALRPLLAALTEGRGRAELLFDAPPKQKIAEELRMHLRRAGVEREELHADDKTRRPLSFHDLRHSFATWLAIGGATELVIQSRLGHASTEQTQHYIAEAEAVGRGDVGAPFAALPSELIEAARIAPLNRSDGWKDQQVQRGGRDSNARKRRREAGNKAFLDSQLARTAGSSEAKPAVSGGPERFGSDSIAFEGLAGAYLVMPLFGLSPGALAG
jgi:integrase